jgi:hypothetical protein
MRCRGTLPGPEVLLVRLNSLTKSPKPHFEEPEFVSTQDRAMRSLSVSQQARLRLARSRLKETLAVDHSRADGVDLLFTIDRLVAVVEDLVSLAEEDGAPDGR